MPKIIEGKWPKNDIRRAFVAGAKWWEFHQTDCTMWQSDQRLAEAEAEKRYASQPVNAADEVTQGEFQTTQFEGVKKCPTCGKLILRR